MQINLHLKIWILKAGGLGINKYFYKFFKFKNMYYLEIYHYFVQISIGVAMETWEMKVNISQMK